MARKGVTYDPADPKYRGSDLRRKPEDLAVEFTLQSGLDGMLHRMVPAFPTEDGPSRLIGWVDHATGGLYSELRHRSHVYAEYFHSPTRYDTATFRFADPTSGSLMFGAMRGKVVRLGLSGVLPPPAPTATVVAVPPAWVDDKPVTEWVRAVLKAQADEQALHALLARVVERTRLRPWAILAAFSPAYAGYCGHRFRPTVDLWRAVKEPDIAFVEKMLPELLLRAKHPRVEGQSVLVEEVRR